MLPQIQFVDHQSEKIFQLGEHALIGISPSNSYYTEERIYQTLAWVDQHFKNYTIFPGQGMSYYNYLSCGYSEKEAKDKTHSQDRLLYNRISRSLEKLNKKNIQILTDADCQNNPNYTYYFKHYQTLFHQDKNLQKIANNIANTLQHSKKPILYPEKAIYYFLYELPFLLNTPAILNLPSSCFIYRNLMPIEDYLYLEGKLHAKNQGFVVVCFD